MAAAAGRHNRRMRRLQHALTVPVKGEDTVRCETYRSRPSTPARPPLPPPQNGGLRCARAAVCARAARARGFARWPRCRRRVRSALRGGGTGSGMRGRSGRAMVAGRRILRRKRVVVERNRYSAQTAGFQAHTPKPLKPADPACAF